MRRSLVATLILAVTLALAPMGAIAQDTSPAPSGGPSIVGAWQWITEPLGGEDRAINYAIFHDDGTFVEWGPAVGEAIGVWEMTGERTADLVFVFQDTDPSFEAWGPGTATFTATVEIAETGDALTIEGTFDLRDARGTQIVTFPFASSATRLTLETNPSTGSIPAGSPAAPSASPLAGATP